MDEAALTQTQQAIRDLLHVDSKRSPAEVYTALAALESRAMPESIQTREMEPEHHPGACCFDKEAKRSAWSAWKLCERCALFNELLQGESVGEPGWSGGGAPRRLGQQFG